MKLKGKNNLKNNSKQMKINKKKEEHNWKTK
jgi:hypothetical protein